MSRDREFHKNQEQAGGKVQLKDKVWVDGRYDTFNVIFYHEPALRDALLEHYGSQCSVKVRDSSAGEETVVTIAPATLKRMTGPQTSGFGTLDHAGQEQARRAWIGEKKRLMDELGGIIEQQGFHAVEQPAIAHDRRA